MHAPFVEYARVILHIKIILSKSDEIILHIKITLSKSDKISKTKIECYSHEFSCM